MWIGPGGWPWDTVWPITGETDGTAVNDAQSPGVPYCSVPSAVPGTGIHIAALVRQPAHEVSIASPTSQ